MIDLLAQMFRLPLALFGGMVETLGRTVRSVEGRAAGRVAAPPPPRRPAAPPPPASDPPAHAGEPARVPIPTHEEEPRVMYDDNRNDEVRLYRYSIVSIEPDDERILVPVTELLVTDNPSDESFRLRVLQKHSHQIGGPHTSHLEVPFEVVGRWQKPDPRYPKRQVRVLEEIRDRIGPAPA